MNVRNLSKFGSLYLQVDTLNIREIRPMLAKFHILIVDDNPFNRVFLSEVLNGEGFSVEEAKNGIEALLKINETDFKLIMLDLLMPGMDGFETAKKIREMGITVPIVAVSALALKQDRQRSLRAGCNDFLPKPIDVKQLRSIVKKYIQEAPGEDLNSREAGSASLSINKDFFLSSSSPFKGLHLILVEEKEQLRREYYTILVQAGFQVNGVANGSDALQFIENPENTTHIVISNIFTSGIDGLGLLTIVKRQFAHIFVFLYTQSYDPSTFQYAAHQKVDGIIPQDQFETATFNIIQSALSQSRLKGSRTSDAKTASLVRQAQAQLIHPGCINLCPSLDVAYQPLHEAGGDLMRCHRFGLEGHCGIVLADVAGHDVISSYTSATFTGILISLWESHKDPLELLKKINMELLKVGNDKSHICATAILWERSSGRLNIACAGNPGALLISFDSDGKVIYKTLTGGGMVLGALDNDDLFIYGSEKMDKDSYLFLFSDGIETEDLVAAIEKRREVFSRSRVNGICQHLIDNILEKKDQEDDLILLCIHNSEKWGKPNFHSEYLSTYDEVDRACTWIDQNLPTDMIPEGNDKDLILLSAREALLNAVEHGNSYKATAHFEVDLHFKKHELRITVSDEGNGFNLKENILKPDDLTLTQVGKRGLSLMSSVAQEVTVDGRSVRLIFKNI